MGLADRVRRAFGELTRKEEEGSKREAIKRLKLVLISDRAKLSPKIVEEMKQELVEVISKYMEVDEKKLQVQLEQEQQHMAITASLPVKRILREQRTGERPPAVESAGQGGDL